jgi:hypothetical protein
MQVTVLLAGSTVLFTTACNDSAAPAESATSLTTVSPVGGATAVDPTAPIVLTFSAPIAQGMEAYMDVHQGTTAGPVMPMSCAWSADRTVLTCTHAAPFEHGAMYTTHIGGGMMDADDMPIDMNATGHRMGGEWLESGMMGGTHAGQPTSGMGPGWHGSNGSYGMMFTFTTS